MIEDRIFYLGEFGQGPLKIYQILNKEYSFDNFSQIDFCTPTLQKYWEIVQQLQNEAKAVMDGLQHGISAKSIV